MSNSSPNLLLRLVRSLLPFALAGIGGTLMAASFLYLYLGPKLPEVDQLNTVELQIPLRIYTHDLQLIAEFGEKKRTPVDFSEIPPPLINAFLAAEDDGFFSHSGVDVKGLIRAALELATTGSIQSGGSTITMQVARNFFLDARQEFARKFNEILLALKIERQLDKESILSLYVNKIYLGNRAYGVGAAAQVYYGLPLDQLSIAQMAMIAGLPKAPSRYNPIANPERAKQRRDWILGRMHRLGWLSQVDFELALAEQDNASYHGSLADIQAAYAAEMARREMIQRYGLSAYTEGLQVITTIDSSLQRAATRAVQTGILEYDWRHGYRELERRELPEEEWQTALQETPISGDLVPAIITSMTAEQLELLMPDGVTATLDWQQGLEGLRRYQSVNSRSAPIKSTDEIFRIGDLIRVRRIDDVWQLSQLPEVQAALVALNPTDAAVQAIVGGFDYRLSNFNRASQAVRQPGSNFKPFLYATAMANGYHPASMINDAPVVFADANLEEAWRPENDGGKFYGPTRLRQALYRSRNLVSIRLLRELGIETALNGIEKFGFDTSEMPRDLSLALGTFAVTPLQVASGYAALANQGFAVSPYLVDKVIDRSGQVVFSANPATACLLCEQDNTSAPEPLQQREEQLASLLGSLSERSLNADERLNIANLQRALLSTAAAERPRASRALDAQSAFLIDSVLRDVITLGTGRRAKVLERTDLAGKTGTTNGPRDAWFSGYSPNMVATAWVGFDDNSQLGRNEYGGSAALPIWINYMRQALEGVPDLPRQQPPGIVQAKIDPATGLRVAAGAIGIDEFFKSGQLPPLQRQQPSDQSLSNDLF